MIRVLAFNAYYEPEIAASMYLNVCIFEGMSGDGWAVDLFVPMPTRGVDDETRKEYKSLKLEKKGNLSIHRVPLMREGKGTIGRAFRYMLMHAKFFIKGLSTKADVIFVQSTPPTMGAMAAIIKKFKRIPFVYGLQDIFPDSLVSTGIAKRGSMAWKIGRIIENFTYRNADKIIVISNDFKKNLLGKGVPEEKIEVIYNWVDENTMHPIPKAENPFFEKFGVSRDDFNVVYAGNLGHAQDLDVLINVAKELGDFDDIKFWIFGNGVCEISLKERIASLQLRNIKMYPLQPAEYAANVYSLADAALVSCKKGCGGSAMPSKTWSIMSASRPVIASFDETELKDIIDDNKCGIFTKAGDKKALKNAILELYNDRERCEAYGKNGRRFIMENLTVDKGTDAYRRIIELATKSKKKD